MSGAEPRPSARRRRCQLFPCRDSLLSLSYFGVFPWLEVCANIILTAVMLSSSRRLVTRVRFLSLSLAPRPARGPHRGTRPPHSLTRSGNQTARIPARVCSCFQSHGGALRRQELRLQDLAVGGRGSQGRQGRLDRPLRRSVQLAPCRPVRPTASPQLGPLTRETCSRIWSSSVVDPLYPILAGFGLCGTAGELESPDRRRAYRTDIALTQTRSSALLPSAPKSRTSPASQTMPASASSVSVSRQSFRLSCQVWCAY